MRWFNKQLPNMSDRTHRVRTWLDTDVGQYLVSHEKACIDHQLSTVFGQYAVAVSLLPCDRILDNCRVARCYSLSSGSLTESGSRIVSDVHHWPVRPESLDFVCLHHTIECSDTPHRLLSEAAKSIIPGGKLMIIGFNPWSLLGAVRRVWPSYCHVFHGVHFISLPRMKDWLTLLGFRIDYVGQGACLLPVSLREESLSTGLAKRFSTETPSFLGGFYLMIATREKLGMTPIKMSWASLGRSFIATNPVMGSRPAGESS